MEGGSFFDNSHLLLRPASKWSQASSQTVLNADLQFQLPLFCGSFTVRWNLIFTVRCRLLTACKKAWPEKRQSQWNQCWMLVAAIHFPVNGSCMTFFWKVAAGPDWPDPRECAKVIAASHMPHCDYSDALREQCFDGFYFWHQQVLGRVFWPRGTWKEAMLQTRQMGSEEFRC